MNALGGFFLFFSPGVISGVCIIVAGVCAIRAQLHVGEKSDEDEDYDDALPEVEKLKVEA